MRCSGPTNRQHVELEEDPLLLKEYHHYSQLWSIIRKHKVKAKPPF